MIEVIKYWDNFNWELFQAICKAKQKL